MTCKPAPCPCGVMGGHSPKDQHTHAPRAPVVREVGDHQKTSAPPRGGKESFSGVTRGEVRQLAAKRRKLPPSLLCHLAGRGPRGCLCHRRRDRDGPLTSGDTFRVRKAFLKIKRPFLNLYGI